MDRILLNDGTTMVSGLSLGSWAFSGAGVWGECDEQAAVDTVHCAIERGINLIDTAEGYGNGRAEAVLGRAIGDRRSQVVLASKVHVNHMGYEELINACEDSLKRLGTDYFDIYQVHWFNRQIPVEESYRAFDKLKQDGKILHVGVCNHGEGALGEVGDYPVVTDQLPYSLLWRVAEHHLGDTLRRKNILLWAYSPLAQGLLTGKYKKLEEVPMNRRTTRMYDSKWGAGRHTDHGYEKEIFEFLEKLGELCRESGYSMQAFAFGYLKQNPAVGSILAGARTIRQLEENLAAYETQIEEPLMRMVCGWSDELKACMGTNADLWENSNHGQGRLF